MAHGAGAFFGLTTLGPNKPFAEASSHSVNYDCFNSLSKEDYMAAFDKYLMGDSSTAKTLEVDGQENILRAALGDMLRELLGRQPRKHELGTWFTWMDFDREVVMSRDQYSKSVDMLLEFTHNPGTPKVYTSYNQLRKDWLRHARVPYDLQKTCKEPITLAQEIGWHTRKVRPPQHTHHSNHTDVTKGEGMTLKGYYGPFTVLDTC